MNEENNINENEVSLDDDQRIKILSPTALVVKRFVRNKLAITGSVFILTMFLLSFVGGWLMPYDESQVFTKYTDMSKLFAGISQNTEYKYTIVDDMDFSLIAQSQFVLAANKEEEIFESNDTTYRIVKYDDKFYTVLEYEEVAVINSTPMEKIISTVDKSLGDDFKNTFLQASNDGIKTVELNGLTYFIEKEKKSEIVYVAHDLAVATINIFDYAEANIRNSYDFVFAVESAVMDLTNSGNISQNINLNGKEYIVKSENGMVDVYILNNGTEEIYASVTDYLVQPLYDDIFLSLDFKAEIKQHIIAGDEEFDYLNEEGNLITYKVFRENLQWTIERDEDTYVIDQYASPSKDHWLGTDGNGMDLVTRLMYGGRVSLIIGFIVVVIQTFIGIVLGGIAGYFGGFIDNLIMRVVDVFNCIPSLPLLIILGSMMDQLRVDPFIRMMYLMIILGFLGWPGIARMVRGQILSLREQEFITATEATGLAVSKRIFKHLIPNVIPQLIVICTLSLGGIILTEATLSFLGIGVKFPFASWGNIITAVSNVHVMTNYLFVWIPAGFCILITVLGFNFMGDGLRDAFDPKMKR